MAIKPQRRMKKDVSFNVIPAPEPESIAATQVDSSACPGIDPGSSPEQRGRKLVITDYFSYISNGFSVIL